MLQITEIVHSVIYPDSKWAESLNFFIYDSIKITVLLFVMIFAIGFIRTYIPQHKVKSWISGRKSGNLLASVFGAITPFCSCSSIPLFIGFLEAGIPLGVAFSFLITSPIVNEYLAVLMLGLFGWKITLAYITTGILIGTISGWALGKMKLEKHLVKDLVAKRVKEIKHDGIRQRVNFALKEATSILKKLWIWILAGIAIGAIIHNHVPAQLIQAIGNNSLAVPVAVILGVPMYGSSAAIVPIAVALFQKGIPLGTAIAFMIATAAISLPEAIILRRAMNLKLIAIFFGVVTLAIILTGYTYNLLQALL